MLKTASHLILGFILLLLWPNTLVAEESLFSEVAMESVFVDKANGDVDVATATSGERMDRITGTSSLMLILKSAGFEPTVDTDRVAITIQHAGLNLPAKLRVEIEKDRIVCELNLAVIEDKSKVQQSKLLELFASSDTLQNAFFAYETNSDAIQLRSSFSNRDVSAQQIQADLLGLATLADQTSHLWLNLNPSAETSETVASTSAIETKKEEASPASAEKFTLVGLWSATLAGGESIAIEIKDDKSFKLATVKSKKSSLSSGKWTQTTDRLTLVGTDNVSLSGFIKQSTANRFELKIQNASGQPQLTIDFSRAK